MLNSSPTAFKSSMLKKFQTAILYFTIAAFGIASISLAIYAAMKIDESEVSEIIVPYVNGSGATFPVAIYNVWLSAYTINLRNLGINIKMDYFSVGSTLGRAEFFNGINLYGATDSDITKNETAYALPLDYKLNDALNSSYINPKDPLHLGLLMIPSVGGGLAIVYNAKGIDNGLVLDGPVIEQVFSGKILWWNDTRIKGLNPDRVLPEQKLVVIGRGDKSGSTTVFTKYLSGYGPTKVSDNPTWPSTFVTRNSALELLYVCETSDYSITYAPLDNILSAASKVKFASVINRKGVIVAPTREGLVGGMKVDAPFKKHGFISITDSPEPDAYPLTLLTFLLFREHYFFNSLPLSKECNRVKYMVKFWMYNLEATEAIDKANNLGWIPLSNKLKDNSVEALKRITCGGQLIFTTIEKEDERARFYNDPKLLSFKTAIPLNNGGFRATKIGSWLTIVLYAGMVLACIVPTAWNFYGLYKSSRSDAETTKNVHDKVHDKESALQEKEKSDPSRVPFTAANIFAIFAIVLNFVQYAIVIMVGSDTLGDKGLLSQIGKFFLSYTAFGFYLAGATAWVFGMFFILSIYPTLLAAYPIRIMKYQSLVATLVSCLSGFSVLFVIPLVESAFMISSCRFSEDSGKYLSKYSGQYCWEHNHWVWITLTILFVVPYVFMSVRYTGVFKKFGSKTDFHDKDWVIALETPLKCIAIFSLGIFPAKAHLIIQSLLLLIPAVLFVIYRSNTVRWLDLVRSCLYSFNFCFALCLAVLEFEVDKENYNLRNEITNIIDPIVISGLVLNIIMAFVVFQLHLLNNTMNATERAKQQAELEEFFKSFAQQVEGNNDEHSTEPTDGPQSLPEKSGPSTGNEKKVSNHSLSVNGSRGSSLDINQWSKLQSMIDKAATISLITKKQHGLLNHCIARRESLILVILSTSKGNFSRFCELLDLSTWSLLEIMNAEVEPSNPKARGSQVISNQQPTANGRRGSVQINRFPKTVMIKEDE